MIGDDDAALDLATQNAFHCQWEWCDADADKEFENLTK